MIFKVKKLIFSISFNSILFFLLLVGIQNSAKKNKVYFFGKETVQLPISFIIGISFITGSILGSFIPTNFDNNESGN